VEQPLREVPLLVLDDLGAERLTDWVTEALFRLINHRFEWRLRTVITTNYSPNEMAERVGERTWWRVVQLADLVRVAGPNLSARLRGGNG
jgi:DNA replication protein DnaC